MSTYVFKAIDVAGVKARGLIVLDIADKHSSRELNIPLFERVTPPELAVFSRQLATMVSSGMSILRALYVLEEQTDSKLLKSTIVQVRKDVEAGMSLSDSMDRHPKVFNPLFVAMARAGEAGGMLESSLLRVADQLESDASLRRQIKSAMVYPALVVTFAMLVMIALVAFLVPVFEGVFKEFGGKLPFITQIAVGISKAVTGEWYLLIFGVAAIVTAFIKWKKSTKGRKQWDRFRLRVPMKIGAIVQQVAIARWARTLSSLVSAGVPLLLALDITGKTAGNVVVEESMEGVITSVKQGGTIARPLAQSPIFPRMVTQMVGVGEETGALDAMLAKIADFYEDQAGASVKSLTSILEPIMIIVIGGIVGFIVIAMYMPLFSIYNQIE